MIREEAAEAVKLAAETAGWRDVDARVFVDDRHGMEPWSLRLTGTFRRQHAEMSASASRLDQLVEKVRNHLASN